MTQVRELQASANWASFSSALHAAELIGLDIERGLAPILAAPQKTPTSIEEPDKQVRRWVVVSMPSTPELSGRGSNRLPEAIPNDVAPEV